MSQLTDEQILQLLEIGVKVPDTHSAQERHQIRLYKLLFTELKQEPPIQPGTDFSVQVMSRIGKLEQDSSDRLVYGWLAFSLAVSLLVGYYVVAPFEGGSITSQEILASLKPYQRAFIFGLCSLLVFSWLDWKLIREASLPKLS